MRLKAFLFAFLMWSVCAFSAFAQNSVKIVLQEDGTGEPVSFATVTVTKAGAKSPAYAGLTDDKGAVTIPNVRNGSYTVKAELLGYKPYSKEIKVSNASVDLGTVKMDQDRQSIDAATVSAVGNPILIKKDTIEYNASSFKTSENDVLEDLLKKLPGVEVGEDGSITVNGETITKITIDNKTFFLDDPQLASKNLPAKMINKLKVIKKKSEQAEFTGIDDGEEENVIDLSVKPGMMKGVFGSVSGGVGHDAPTATTKYDDYRYQGAGFIGKFTSNQQLSGLFNVNNTNNRGFNDLSGSMMQGMRGGGGGMGRGGGGWGGGNGIITSYMGGLNGAWDLFDNKMNLGANYLFNGSNRTVEEESTKTTYQDDYNLIYDTKGLNLTNSYGHRFGMRLDHKFSDNTSILFQPQVSFGNGNYSETSDFSTVKDNGDNVNKGSSLNSGANKNFSTNGFALFRQRLGIPGRTLSLMARYSFSNNNMDGINKSETYTFDGKDPQIVDQNFHQASKSASLSGRLTYTEPLGDHFYVEGNYSYSWSRSQSEKKTFDTATGELNKTYSNSIVNEHINQEIGANMLYQSTKLRAQVGFSGRPTHTYNETTKYDASKGTMAPKAYDSKVWNFAPQAMLMWDITDNYNMRFFYRGQSSQPSTSQLMPVPDNTDPLNVSFGNPSLQPYFSHSLRGEFRFNDRKTFTSFSINMRGGMVKDPIISAVWTDAAGVQYSMPFNGDNSANASVNFFLNMPIAKSNFSISNSAGLTWNRSTSFLADKFDMSPYYSGGELDYDAFLEAFNSGKLPFQSNILNSFNVNERLRVIYRSDALELSLSGNTRMRRSIYSVKTSANTKTFNNQIRASLNWTWSETGIGLKSDFNYNWYNGYTTAMPSEYVLNAEITKLLFKNKVTLALKGYDIFGQAKNLSITDNANYHMEAVNNTLGRYIILSLTYRFGTFDRGSMRRGGQGNPGGPGGGPMGGPGARPAGRPR